MAKTAFLNIPVKDLTVLPELQRDLRKSLVTRIADDWDIAKAGVLQVAELDIDGHTHWHVFDGQHRLAAGESVDPTMSLPCYMHYDLSEQEVAALFVGMNEVRGAVGAYDQYRIGLVAKEPVWVHVDAAVTKAGVQLGRAPSTNTIAAVAGCKKVVQAGHAQAGTLGVPGQWGYGREHLVDTIKVLKQAWKNGGSDRWSGALIEGTARFMRVNPATFAFKDNHKRLSALLAAKQPHEWNAEIVAVAKGSSGSGGRPIILADLLTEAWDTAHPGIVLN